MKFDDLLIQFMETDFIELGITDEFTIEQVADIHNTDIDNIRFRLASGRRIEESIDIDDTILTNLVHNIDYYTTEMTSCGVVGDSGDLGGGFAPQDSTHYADGDARIPTSIFSGDVIQNPSKKEKKKTKRKKKKTNKTMVLRRPPIRS